MAPANQSITWLTDPQLDTFREVRQQTVQLCRPLQIDDYVAQSMPVTSPAKWHLAHTTWFWEEFVLKPYLPNYRCFRDGFELLFNSYYHAVGPQLSRHARGLLTRPTVKEVYDYRNHVDEHMEQLLSHGLDTTISDRVTLGRNHEQQHQELLFTDIKHLFSTNPTKPIYRARLPSGRSTVGQQWLAYPGGLQLVGSPQRRFCFDNETPRHHVILRPFELSNRLVTNDEYRQFIDAGGYRNPQLWLADGWEVITAQQWQRPLYWDEALTHEFTLSGMQPLEAEAPVSHISYYEADAYARWRGARLPLEAEWEIAASLQPCTGNLLEQDQLRPLPATGAGLCQLFGDVWEWTASPYSAYPGYRAPAGAIGEYNGKFMANQFVLRGGSFATPQSHIRATYRNFFHPDARWQFSGIRLARDAS